MIVERLRAMVEDWNEESLCDSCWAFVHARRDHANLYNPKDCKCGVTFFLESVKEDDRYTEDDYGSTLSYTDFIVGGMIGIQSRMDEVYDDENEGVSKYDKYIKKITDCIRSRMSDDSCLEGIYPMQVKLSHVINKKDNNYDGVEYTAIYRKRWT